MCLRRELGDKADSEYYCFPWINCLPYCVVASQPSRDSYRYPVINAQSKQRFSFVVVFQIWCQWSGTAKSRIKHRRNFANQLRKGDFVDRTNVDGFELVVFSICPLKRAIRSCYDGCSSKQQTNEWVGRWVRTRFVKRATRSCYEM